MAATINVPKPIPVPVDTPDADDDNKIIVVHNATPDADDIKLLGYISEGSSLVMLENITNNVMILNVLEINNDTTDPDFGTITLTEPIDSSRVSDYFWVIPSSAGSSRNPCIAVYTQTFTF